MTQNEQNVKAGDDSVVVQANNLTVHNGMTATEVVQLAEYIISVNLPKMEEKATEVAYSRAKELVETVVNKAIDKKLENFDMLSSPRKQNDLLQAQRGFAFSDGNDDLKKVLADLVASSLGEKQEYSLNSITFSEAIAVAAKITKEQIVVLTTFYMFEFFSFMQVHDIGSFIKVFESYLDNLKILDVKAETGDFLHLEYVGCIAISQVRSGNFQKILQKKYPGIFSSGLEKETVQQTFPEEVPKNAFMTCMNDSTKFQVAALNEGVLEILSKKHDWTEQQTNSLLILLKQSVMKENKILELIKEKSEKISDFIEQWNTTTLGGMRLTNVGRAIAHVHLEDCAGIEEDFRL